MGADGLKVLQCNVMRSFHAHHEFVHHFVTHDFDVALVTEPYVGRKKEVKNVDGLHIHQFPSSGRVKSCVMVKNHLQSLGLAHHSSSNIVTVELKASPSPSPSPSSSASTSPSEASSSSPSIYLSSVYIEPDDDVSDTLTKLSSVALDHSHRHCIIGGDVNGRHTIWGSDRTDCRGAEVLDVLASANFFTCNLGRQHTFQTVTHGHVRTSLIDVTACSERLLSSVRSWRVNMEACPSSDHNAIDFIVNVNPVRSSSSPSPSPSTFLYNNRIADWKTVSDELQRQLAPLMNTTVTDYDDRQLDTVINRMTRVIQDSCHRTMKLKGSSRPYNPWWTPELEVMKKTVIHKHHRLHEVTKRRQPLNDIVSDLTAAKKEYAKAIATVSKAHFRSFCQAQGKEDVWSVTNRLLKDAPSRRPSSTVKLPSGFTTTAKETANEVLKHFYPDDADDMLAEQTLLRAKFSDVPDTDDDVSVTSAEVIECLAAMNPNKAPGYDHLTSDIVTAAVNVNVDFVTSLFNRCLEIGHFPKPWKTAVVRILPKPGKDDYSDVSSLRPIGLIPIFGKLFEKILIRRLTFATSAHWSQRQFGFREQTSTSDALHTLIDVITDAKSRKMQVAGISLDIKGAFDNAWWPLLMERLRQTKCPKNIFRTLLSYHQDRQVTYTVGDETVTKSTSKGCVQGSVCGPTFWNIIVDELLELQLPDGCHIQAFADDVMLIVTGKTSADVILSGNSALDIIFSWGRQSKLTFSPAKTQAIAFTHKLRPSSFTVNDDVIVTTHEIKLLGVIIDHNLNFISHTKYIITKASKVFNKLCMYVRPTWGIHPANVETIYRQVIEPMVCYAAGVWGDAVKRQSVRKRLRSFQRLFAIRAIRAFRTVSASAALALAQFKPLHLKIDELRKVDVVKRNATFDVLPDDLTLERKSRPLQLLHPADRQSITFHSSHTQEDADRHCSLTNIFTDGSKLEDGKTGAAFVIQHPNGRHEKRKLKLSSICTVFQAELLAIDQALQWIEKRASTDVTIFSDSQSSLTALQDRSNAHPLVVSSHRHLKTINDAGRTVTFVWVKAHVGIDGNEEADEAAKEAALSRQRMVYDLFPISYVKHHVKKSSLEAWEAEYGSAEQGSWTRSIFPSLKDIVTFRTSVDLSFEVTQFLTGHGYHRQYLHRFKLHPSPNCPCGLGEQTVQHLLDDCPRYGNERRNVSDVADRHGLDITRLHKYFNHERLRSHLIDFTITIVRSLKAFNESSS